MRAIMAMCSALVMASAFAGPAAAQQKTVKACQQEWRADKAANQAKGITEKAYVAQCRAGAAASTAPGPANSAAQTSPPAQTSPSVAQPRRAAAPRTTTAAAPAAPRGANEFTTEAQAKAHCPGSPVVWANLKSKVYHFPGTRNYGTTKTGAYMCERDADSAGMRAAKNEKKPG